jgi:hypothetical protein
MQYVLIESIRTHSVNEPKTIYTCFDLPAFLQEQKRVKLCDPSDGRCAVNSREVHIVKRTSLKHMIIREVLSSAEAIHASKFE